MGGFSALTSYKIFLCLLSFCAFCVLSGVPEYREEVARGAGDDEEVPDEMVVADSLRGKEREAAGVRDPARKY